MYSIVCNDTPIAVLSFTKVIDTRVDMGGVNAAQHQQIIYSIAVTGILHLTYIEIRMDKYDIGYIPVQYILHAVGVKYR